MSEDTGAGALRALREYMRQHDRHPSVTMSAKQINLMHSVIAHFDAWQARAESAEAEVQTLRAHLTTMAAERDRAVRELREIEGAFGNPRALDVCKTLAEKARHSVWSANEYHQAHARLNSERAGIAFDFHIVEEGGQYFTPAEPGPIVSESLRMALRAHLKLANDGAAEDRATIAALTTRATTAEQRIARARALLQQDNWSAVQKEHITQALDGAA